MDQTALDRELKGRSRPKASKGRIDVEERGASAQYRDHDWWRSKRCSVALRRPGLSSPEPGKWWSRLGATPAVCVPRPSPGVGPSKFHFDADRPPHLSLRSLRSGDRLFPSSRRSQIPNPDRCPRIVPGMTNQQDAEQRRTISPDPQSRSSNVGSVQEWRYHRTTQPRTHVRRYGECRRRPGTVALHQSFRAAR
jgi:hypothetical protein